MSKFVLHVLCIYCFLSAFTCQAFEKPGRASIRSGDCIKFESNPVYFEESKEAEAFLKWAIWTIAYESKGTQQIPAEVTLRDAKIIVNDLIADCSELRLLKVSHSGTLGIPKTVGELSTEGQYVIAEAPELDLTFREIKKDERVPFHDFASGSPYETLFFYVSNERILSTMINTKDLTCEDLTQPKIVNYLLSHLQVMEPQAWFEKMGERGILHMGDEGSLEFDGTITIVCRHFAVVTDLLVLQRREDKAYQSTEQFSSYVLGNEEIERLSTLISNQKIPEAIRDSCYMKSIPVEFSLRSSLIEGQVKE